MADLAQIRSGFIGLTTARSPEVTPPGGLLEAENVCIRTQNVITPRPGFGDGVLGLTDPALGIVPYPLDTNTQSIVHDGTDTQWTSGDPLEDEDSNALVWEAYTGVVARRSLFLCTADATRVVHYPGSLTAYRAGVPAPSLGRYKGIGSTSTTSGGGPAVLDSQYRAYRVVVRRDRVSNLQSHISRSAPSNRYVLFEGSGPANERLYVYLHGADDFLVGDVLEVYATENSTTIPVEEYYLSQEHSLTAADLAARCVSLLDDVPDEGLGAALYTNESREGAEAANYRPPAAGCMAEFNNSLWLGDLTYPAAIDLSVRMTSGLAADDEVGVYDANGVATNGSAVVSSVAAGDIANLKVGMVVYRQGTDQHAGTGYLLITAVGATTYTLNQIWNGATGAQTNVAADAIKVGAESYPAHEFVEAVRGAAMLDGLNQQNTASTLYTADWTTEVSETEDYRPIVGLRISAILSNTAPPEVWATNGHLYSPDLPEPTAGTGFQMPQEILPDNVAWSKADEPDHFPLTNIERVGRSGSTVYDMKASRGSVLLFTDLGVWRGSGYADSGITFSELDKDVRILGRRCAAEAGPNIYVWADNGVYECDENGCTSITKDKLADLDAPAALIALLRSSLARVTCNAKNDEVIVCAPAAASSTSFTALYVFNYHTRAWTKWTAPRAITDFVMVGRSQVLTGTRQSAPETMIERLPTSAAYGSDAAGSGVVSVNTVVGSTVTIAGGSGYTPLVGDVIASDSVPATRFMITAVASATVFTVHTSGLALGSATVFGAIACVVTPSVNTAKTPHFMKAWAEGTLQWARRAGVYAFTLAFRSSISGLNTATTQSRQLSSTLGANADARSAPATSRFIVPRAAARGTHLCFSLTIRQALSDWAIEALSVRCRTTADKAPARLP